MRNKDRLNPAAATTAELQRAANTASGTYKNKLMIELRKRGA